MSTEMVVFHNERIYVIPNECDDEEFDEFDDPFEDDVYTRPQTRR